MDGRMGWMISSSAANWVAIATPVKLKRKGFCKTSENRKEICAAAKAFHENTLPETAYRHYEKVCICTVL